MTHPAMHLATFMLDLPLTQGLEMILYHSLHLYSNLIPPLRSYSSEVNVAYLPSRGKRLLCYTTCTFLTGVTYSVTTVPLTSGRISLGNFETTKYREDNCYFVIKISLIYSNGRTKPAIKYQALVSSSFPRLNHLY